MNEQMNECIRKVSITLGSEFNFVAPTASVVLEHFLVSWIDLSYEVLSSHFLP